MHKKSTANSWVLFCSALILAFILFPLSLAAQELYLQAGTTTTVNSGEASCVHQPKSTTGPDSANCSGGRPTMYLSSTSLGEVNVSGTSQLVVQFQVDTQPGAPDASFLPVQIAVPVVWKGLLGNPSVVPLKGPLESVAAYVDVNGSLELVEGQPGAPGNLGTEVSTNHFMGAYHAGISGCISLPKTAVKAAIMAAKCAAGVLKKEEGDGTIYLSGLIQTGQTYDVVLDLEGDIHAGNALVDGQPNLNFRGIGQPDPSFGLKWSGPMTITIGTDFQGRIQGIQDQVDQLRSQLRQLRHDFDVHTHVYLTGKGVGQNNTRVTTGRPVY